MARKSQFPQSVNPGIPKEQKLPEGWKLAQFGDVLKVVERHAKLQDEDEYQLVTAKRNREGIIPRGKLLGKKILTKNQYYLRSGDFLISRRQIIHGACGIVPESLDGAIASNEYSTLLPTNNILLEYLSYYSHTTHFQQCCFHSSIGVDVEKMVFKIDDWLHHKIPLPPISEQEMICSIVGSVDDAIQATQAVIDQTQRVKRGVLQQLLTHGIGHTQFKQTEIGEIPEEWEVLMLKDIGEIFTGKTPPTSNKLFWDGDVPFIAPGDINQKKYVCNTERFVSSNGADYVSNILPKDTVLVVCIGSTIGKVAMTSKKSITNQQINSIICNNSINPNYIYYAIFYRSNEIKILSGTTAVPIINKSQFSKFKISLPSFIEQNKIAAILSSMDDKIQATQALLDQNLKVKQSLMQDLLTGRVRVKLNEVSTT
jgi:type I restriction enzyme S subunit